MTVREWFRLLRASDFERDPDELLRIQSICRTGIYLPHDEEFRHAEALPLPSVYDPDGPVFVFEIRRVPVPDSRR